MRYISIFILLIISFSVLAQKTEQAVYFKNGNIIHGDIVELNLNEFIKIRNYYNDTLIFKLNEIDSIKEVRTIKQRKQIVSFKTKGYYNQTGFAKLIDYSSSWYSPMFFINSLTSINGYKYNNYYAGFGIGVELQNYVTFPLFVELKYILDREKINPILFFQSGYVLPYKFHDEPYDGASVDYFGGLMFNPGVGIQFAINKNTAWYIIAAYRYQTLKRKELYPNSSLTEVKEFINRAVIRVGIQFY